jgi:hypothetical protein
LIFFIGEVDKNKPVPIGAFGITDDFEDLIHYVLDVLERKRI